MNKTAALTVALEEAHRFIDRANKALNSNELMHGYGGPKTASAKRASLDLTKALAEFRKAQ